MTRIDGTREIFTGYKFLNWELLEYSQVPIPANQDVVQNAITMGWITKDHVDLFFDVEQAKPVEPAFPGTDAEPAIDTTAAEAAISGVLRSFALDDAARRLSELKLR